MSRGAGGEAGAEGDFAAARARGGASGTGLAAAGLAVLLALGGAAAPVLAEDEAEARTPAPAGQPPPPPPPRPGPGLAPSVERLAEAIAALDAQTPPGHLVAVAEALGVAVARAREGAPERALLERLTDSARELGEKSAAVAVALEARAGEDEAALEQLFRSDGWRLVEYADVLAQYGLGWALLTQGQADPPSARRTRTMREAERALARSSLEIALPRIATLSLLGLGIVQRELGQHERAVVILERFVAQMERGGDGEDGEALAAARFELALLALEAGDARRGGALRREIPPQTLGSAQRRTLLAREAWLWLEAAARGESGARTATEAAERAAELLRELQLTDAEGGTAAQRLALAYRAVLAGREIGTAGELLGAERAFAAGRMAEASEAYARWLQTAGELGLGVRSEGGVVEAFPAVVERYATAVAHGGGDGARARSLLARVPPDLGGVEGWRRRAELTFHLALREDPEPAVLRDAALEVVERAPHSETADRARLWLAEREEDPREALQILALASPGSRAEGPVLIARIRSRAALLGATATRAGQVADGEAAELLLRDLERVEALRAAGSLAREPERDATLAVLRAQAAAWAGRTPGAVLALAEVAAASPGLGRRSRRSLLRLQLQSWLRAGGYAELGARLTATGDAALRRDLAIWREALDTARRETAAPPQLLVQWSGRLAALASGPTQKQLQLAEAEILLGAGRGAEAAALAERLVAADAHWGEAWLLRARASEAQGAFAAAGEAWGRVASGVPVGRPLWLEAELGRARALRAAGERDAACRALGRAMVDLPAGSPAVRRLEVQRTRCREEGAGGEP